MKKFRSDMAYPSYKRGFILVHCNNNILTVYYAVRWQELEGTISYKNTQSKGLARVKYYTSFPV